jgi:glyoxylase-like metal-dependent hydrolase (beta-lactamase superfamily II)
VRLFFACKLCIALAAAAALLSVSATNAHAQAAVAQQHVAASKAAVSPAGGVPPRQEYLVYQALFDQFCVPPKNLPDVVRQEDRGPVPPREKWYVPPVQMFDNLYFIGTNAAGIYVVNSPDGMAMIDTNFEWDAKDLVLELKDFGLDPNNIKYIIVTQGHDDRYWGAKSLQDTYPNAHIVMSAADWDVVAKDNSPDRVKPRKDMVATDGQKFKLGDATITTYITPGHTPGTISPIITGLTNKTSAHPDNVTHTASLWGGADINLGRAGVQYWADGQAMMRTYIASMKRFQELNEKAGTDVILSTNMRHISVPQKLQIWREMNPDRPMNGAPAVTPELASEVAKDPNSFISKDAVKRYYTVLDECYEAQLAWRIDP